jgi:hypothetical protein
MQLQDGLTSCPHRQLCQLLPERGSQLDDAKAPYLRTACPPQIAVYRKSTEFQQKLTTWSIEAFLQPICTVWYILIVQVAEPSKVRFL